MLLSGRMLNNVTTVNSFNYAETAVQFTQGDTVDLFFQTIDASRDLATKGFSPSGFRYMPISGATMMVTLGNVDSNVAITRAAVQPYPTQDPSIWKVSLLSSDTVSGTISIKIVLNEGGKLTTGRINCAALGYSSSTLCNDPTYPNT